MDIKSNLQEQIRKCRRKMNLAKLIDCGITFAAMGGVLGIVCEALSLYWQFYYVHLAAGLCLTAGFLTGIGVAVYRRADMGQAARRLDSFGLKERMITAWEQMDKETEIADMQRKDALTHYEQQKEQIKISLFPDKRHVLAFVLSVAAVVGLGFVPSVVRDQAKIRHQVQEQAKEEEEKLEALLDALDGVDMDSLTQEQKTQLKELAETMELSREELAKADSWESLGSAMERLDYKYEHAGQSLEKLAAQMDNPDGAGIAAAEALAKAMANQNGQLTADGQMASAGTSGANSGDGSSEEGSDGNGNTEGGSGENDGSGNGEEEGSGNGNGNGTESGNGSGNGNSNGNGDGNSNGNGDGNGNGSGSGNGSGGGSGNGRGTGSSNASHDYVSIPNAVSDDASLTGNKTGDQNSDYFRQQNGLAWEGERVDYNSVIGEYMDNAYEGIATGRYPSGMEPVIRDYFENLNQ